MTQEAQKLTDLEPGSVADPTRLIEIEVNNRPVPVPHQTTGAEIKRRANVPADFELFRIEGKQEIPVGDDEPIQVHPHERFTASPDLDPS